MNLNPMKNKLRLIRAAFTGKGAFKQLTGCETFEEIKWAYDSLHKDDQVGCQNIARKMRLRKPETHGAWLWAFMVVKGDTYRAAIDKGKKTNKDLKTFDKVLDKATNKVAKRMKIGDEDAEH